ncbi:hypothetical protein MLD38_029078 [Melastoma candidum]|uniref:Uncharacterized protein n=1 Tax=Melastoma candidum TaxID=119954 RepID=A0ACB9N313_9MYRT|nr:hypothetical protein MLD38_029078 [Melastoma candidum]
MFYMGLQVESVDLIAYGLIPKFIGRLPIIVSLSALTEDEQLPILKEPKNALGKQYKKMFLMTDVELRFSENAYQQIARKALARNMGARGLRALLEDMLTEAMFEVPGDRQSSSTVSVVLVDEKSVGTINGPVSGAKILHRDSRVEAVLL